MIFVEDATTKQYIRFFHGHTQDFPKHVEYHYSVLLYSTLMRYSKDRRKKVDIALLIDLTRKGMQLLGSHPNPVIKISISDAPGYKGMDFSKAEGRDENFFYFYFGKPYSVHKQFANEPTFVLSKMVASAYDLIELLELALTSGSKIKVIHGHP